MEYVTLGRTGLRVSVAGCGGFSQLGLAQGKTEDDAIAIIRRAVDLGVNLFDTAAAYGTEAVLGRAIKSVRRDEVVITTKAPFSFSNPHSTPEGIVASLDKSLHQLDTSYVDVYQLHGVPPDAYEHALNELAPVLLRVAPLAAPTSAHGSHECGHLTPRLENAGRRSPRCRIVECPNRTPAIGTAPCR
jgi:aryl-alcohol dehydrogenase-like predicted oxidoreductase